MRVLTEFSRDLTDVQLPSVGPIILQEIYRIFQNENVNSIGTSEYFLYISLHSFLYILFLQQYSIRTRGRAVEIFVTVATLIVNTVAFEDGFIQQYLLPIIPMFCEKFGECLRANGPNSDSGFKTDIIKAINSLMKLPKYVTDFLPQMLPPIWETLCQSAKVYQEITVNADEDVNEKEIDSDGILSHNVINIIKIDQI